MRHIGDHLHGKGNTVRSRKSSSSNIYLHIDRRLQDSTKESNKNGKQTVNPIKKR